jgi:hypothetical protein
MFRIFLFVVTALFLATTTLGFYSLGKKLNSEDILLIFSTIGTISGLIFTVAGLWAGYVFPEAIKVVFSGLETSDKSKRVKEYESILIPVVLALLCVVVSLSIPPLHRIAKLCEFPSDWILRLKGIGGILSLLLFTSLGWAIIKIILPSVHCLATMRNKVANDAEADDRDPVR